LTAAPGGQLSQVSPPDLLFVPLGGAGPVALF
jgi:hypothetical protein